MASADLNRRKFIGGAATAGIAAAGLTGASVFAQSDATPEAPGGAVDTAGIEANVAGATPIPVGPAVPPELTDSETNWAVEGANLKGTRQALGSTIDTATIAQLGVGWRAAVDVPGLFGALTANPVIVGDVVYVQDANSNVFAWTASTGEVVWTREYNLPVPSGGPNGVAVGYGLAVFPVGSDGLVVAVQADTGEDVWQQSIQGPLGEGITMAPMIYDNTVYISTIPGNDATFYRGGQRGVIHALDASNGTVLWYFDTTTDNLWGNARVNSGGGLWHPPSVDDNGSLYVGIGNAAPYPGTAEFPAGTSRQSDNDYANSIIKINPASASVDWYINVKPFDLFDLDNHLTPILANVSIDGTDTSVAFSSGKHGIVIAVNTDTGEELWRTPVGKHMNDDLQELPAEEYVEVWPGTFGGVETPMAFADGVLYAPVFNMPSFYNGGSMDPSSLDITAATGQMVALDGATGAIIWDVAQPTGTLGGATVVNDLVFTGGLDGVVRAYNVADGSEVWTYQAGAGLNAPFAISGDWLFVPAGGPFIPSTDTADPPPAAAQEVIALTLGGEIQATPQAAASPEDATPAAGGSDVTVNLIDIAFDPRELSIPANTDVQVVLTNTGALPHDFVIDALGVASDLLDGGQSQTLTINAAAGTYEYYCSVVGHRQAGMVGALTVQ